MARFAVTTAMPAKHGFIWYPAEFDQGSLEEIEATLAKHGVIRFRKLVVVNQAGVKVIVRRDEMILGVQAIMTISHMLFDLVEAGEG